MSSITQRNGTAGDGDSLILTPSKLRLHSCVFGPYITCLWLPNAILATLVLLKASSGPLRCCCLGLILLGVGGVVCLTCRPCSCCVVAVLQIGYAVPLQWWLVFLPQWIGHAGHVILVVCVLASVVSRLAYKDGRLLKGPVLLAAGMLKTWHADRPATCSTHNKLHCLLAGQTGQAAAWPCATPYSITWNDPAVQHHVQRTQAVPGDRQHQRAD